MIHCTLTIAAVVVATSVASGSTEWRAELEKAVVAEHNLVRSDPAAYAPHLEKWLVYYRGKRRELPGRRPITTTEGVEAVEEAIRFLLMAKPLPPLVPSKGLSLGARDHVLDSGDRGRMGHEGSDGSEPGDRANRHGEWYGRVGENIVYGGADAREFVIRLLIDDGVAGRGHRKNIFNPDYRVIGVAFGSHSEYRSMCVIAYAAEYDEE